MIPRIVLFAGLAALAVLVTGAIAWRAHVDGLNALTDAQLGTTQAFLATPEVQKDPGKLLGLVGRPDLNVIVRDDATGAVYNYINGGVAPVPRGAMPGAPPGMGGPPPFGAPPPGFPPDRQAPPPPPAQAGPPAQQRGRSPFVMAVANFAHVAPRVAVYGALRVTLVPSDVAMTRWLLTDAGICALALVAIGVAAFATARALARAAREPLLRTIDALEALAGGNFTPHSIEAGDAPEIARLARAYNAAAETVSRSIEERRAAAAEFQRFLADAGHELRTPLTIVGGYIDILGKGARVDDPTARRVLAGMHAETARMRGLVEKMLLLSRLETPVEAPRIVDVAAVSDEVAESMRPGFPGRSILVQCDQSARIHIDEDDLYEAERNLVENALRYAPDSPVEVRATTMDGQVAIEVSDRGPGIPESEQSMIFERFYRGKDRTDSEGSGLGLAIVRRVVERWGGTLSLSSNASGTRFVMRFPIAGGAS